MRVRFTLTIAAATLLRSVSVAVVAPGLGLGDTVVPTGWSYTEMFPDDPQQGCHIPCVDCTVLEPTAVPCPTCGGAGMLFQAAQMCDASTARSFGVQAREMFEAAIDPTQRLRAARACLVELLIYGTPFAAGFSSSELPDDQAAAESLCAAVRDPLRAAWFAAREAERR